MKYSRPLEKGVFLKRYKRFFADIDWKGEVVTAHVPNTGSLKSVNNPGQHCLFSKSDNPERKLKYTLEMIQSSAGHWVGVNTSTPNAVVKEKLFELIGKKSDSEVFNFWGGFDEIKPEYKISAESRLDFALLKKDSQQIHFIEVKNVTLADGPTAQFPDAVSERAQKHLRELMRLIDQGHTAEIVFTVQRTDCEFFSPADDIDPEYGKLLREAIKHGVRVTPLVVQLSADEVCLTSEVLPIRF